MTIILFWFTYFTQHHTLQVHPRWSTWWVFVVSNGWGTSHCIHRPQLLYPSSVDGHQGSFPSVAIVDIAARNIGVQVSQRFIASESSIVPSHWGYFRSSSCRVSMPGFIPTSPGSVSNGDWERSLVSPLLGMVQQGIRAPRMQQLGACPPRGCSEHLFPVGDIGRGYRLFLLLLLLFILFLPGASFFF